MSEQFPANPELTPSGPAEASHEQHTRHPESTPNNNHDQLEAIRQTVEAANRQTRVETNALKEALPQPKPTYVNKELKTQALKRSMRHIQHDLPVTTRLLSKTIHQPAIRRVSAATEQTLARPSGMLGGGICAFVGTLIYVYLSKHLGFSYNYLLFALFFIGGFIIGLLGEFLIHLATKVRGTRSSKH